MFGDFELAERKFKTFMATNVVANYPSYKNIIVSLETNYNKFKNDVKVSCQKILPKIRTGIGSQIELTELIKNYQASIFYQPHIISFFGTRNREINTINNILKKAERAKKVEVDFGGTAEGNICIQVYDFIHFQIVLLLQNF